MKGGGWSSLQAPFLHAYHTAPVHFRSALDTDEQNGPSQSSTRWIDAPVSLIITIAPAASSSFAMWVLLFQAAHNPDEHSCIFMAGAKPRRSSSVLLGGRVGVIATCRSAGRRFATPARPVTGLEEERKLRRDRRSFRRNRARYRAASVAGNLRTLRARLQFYDLHHQFTAKQ